MSGLLINRALQKQLLEALFAQYPKEFNVLKEFEAEAARVNLRYLEEHGLIESSISRFEALSIHNGWRITAAGVDFLLDDGGLSAILDVLTIRLHDDTVRALIEERITSAGLPKPHTERLLDQLRSLPVDATKHLALKLIEKGLDHWQDALPLLERLLNRSS